MKIRAIGEHILVERVADDAYGGGTLMHPTERFDSPIVIPDSWRAKQSIGKVLSVGRGTITPRGRLIAGHLKPGDMILFDHQAGSEVKLDGKTIVVLRESEVLGTI